VVVVADTVGYVAERVAQLVDQRHVLDGQVVGLPRLHQQSLLLGGDDTLTDAGQELRVAQPAEHLGGTERGPPRQCELDERLRRQHVVVERLTPALATALAAHLPPHRVEQRGGDPWELPVALSVTHQLAAELAERAAVEVDDVVTPEHPELLGRPRRLLARRTPHELGHPLRALQQGHLRGVVTDGAQAADHLAQRPQRDRGLAQRRQHPLDVAHEDARRPDHQHPTGLVAPAVGVEEVRRAVQRHDRLARAGATADGDDSLGRCADRAVLLGLDGGNDRVHRPVAGAGQLRHQRALTDDRQIGPGLGVQELVLDADDLLALAAQHASPDHVVRRGRGRLVEDGGGRRPPVDQQRVAVVVAQPDPPDVARLRVDPLVQVEPAEHQPLVRGVELGDPARRLEDHRVALDQAALVAQGAAAVTLARQVAGVAG
jgi:hypothetical protein